MNSMTSSLKSSSPESESLAWYERDVGGDGDVFDVDLTAAENKNTRRKTETDMRIFSSFLLTLGEPRPAETVEPGQLDRYLTTFFSVIKKHDGNDYEPASLRGMLCSIERYLRVRHYPKSLTRDIVFINTRNTLKDRQVILRELAKNTKKSKHDVLTVSFIEKLKQLYNAKEFGPYNPMAVINSLCFAFVVHLKIRKAIDHKQLLWGDISLKSHDSREYLCYEPVQGRDYLRNRLSNISHYRIYGQSEPGSPADPVTVYKLYASKRPSQAMAPDSPFYLGLAVGCQATDQQAQWFKTSPMGVNKLNDLVRMIREITGNLTAMVPGSLVRPADNPPSSPHADPGVSSDGPSYRFPHPHDHAGDNSNHTEASPQRVETFTESSGAAGVEETDDREWCRTREGACTPLPAVAAATEAQEPTGETSDNGESADTG